MRRCFIALGAVGLLFGAVPALALAGDADAPPSPQSLAAQLRKEQAAMQQAAADAERLRASAPAAVDPLGQIRLALLTDQAEYRYRAAVRAEQVLVYRLAADPALAIQVLSFLGPGQAAGYVDTFAGLNALWRVAGIDDLSTVRIPRKGRYAASTPIGELTGYYQQAAASYGIDWTYLASINYIESDFGRANGPSSEGAEGPMQFLPSTWRQYGDGDINSPHDAVFAAARYLKRNGAPADMDLAIFRYNNDDDYVEAVERLAAAIRGDRRWLDRLYYWGTSG